MSSSESSRPYRLRVLLAVGGLAIVAVGILRSLLPSANPNLRIAASALIFSLPLLIIAGIVVSQRLRYSLRALLLMTALASIFLAWSVLPLLRFRQARVVSRVLDRAGMDPGPRIENGSRGNDVQKLPFWLREFSADIGEFRPTREINELEIQSRRQLTLLREHLSDLPHLRHLTFTDITLLPADEVREVIGRVASKSTRPIGLVFEGRPPMVDYVPQDLALAYCWFSQLASSQTISTDRLAILRQVRCEQLSFYSVKDLSQAELDVIAEARAPMISFHACNVTDRQLESLSQRTPETEIRCWNSGQRWRRLWQHGAEIQQDGQ